MALMQIYLFQGPIRRVIKYNNKLLKAYAHDLQSLYQSDFIITDKSSVGTMLKDFFKSHILACHIIETQYPYLNDSADNPATPSSRRND